MKFAALSILLLSLLDLPGQGVHAQVLTSGNGMGESNGNMVMAPVGSTAPVVAIPATVVNGNGNGSGGVPGDGSRGSGQVTPVMAVGSNPVINRDDGGMRHEAGIHRESEGHYEDSYSRGSTTFGVGLGIMGAVLAVIGMAVIVSLWFYRRRRRQRIRSEEDGNWETKRHGGFQASAKAHDPYGEEDNVHYNQTPPSYPSQRVKTWQHTTDPHYPDHIQDDQDPNPDNGSNPGSNSRPSSSTINPPSAAARHPMEEHHYFPDPPARAAY